MNFKYYFSVLAAICCAFILSSCENNPASSSAEEPVPAAQRQNCPDSVYVYNIYIGGIEELDYVLYYQYDANGNAIQSLKNPTSLYVPKHKTEMRYDARNNLIEQQEWSCWANLSEDSTWYKSTQRVMTYNTDDKIATSQIYYWDGREVPEQGKKSCYTWLDDTHATADVYAYHYMGDTTEWKLVDRAEYTYTPNGDVAYEKYILTYYLTDSTNYQPIEYFCEYDSHNNVVLYKSTFMGAGECDTYSYTYDEEGNILVKNTYTTTSDESVLKNKAVYYY